MTSDGLAKVSYLFGATAPDDSADASPLEAPPTDRDAAFPSGSSVVDDGWYDESVADGGDDVAPAASEHVSRDAPERAWIRTEATPERSASRSSGPVFTAEEVPAAPVRTNLSALPNFIPNPVRERGESVESVEETPPSKAAAKTERRAGNVSLNALARKGMSTREMAKLLERRELDSDVIASEIERLEGAGLLDDRALAENLVRTLQDRKGLGKSAVQAELRRRQLDDTAITEVMADVDADDELERAIEVATKRAGQLRSYDDETAKRRLSAYLQRRGYGGSVLSAAMKAAFDGSGSGGSRGSGPRFS
ncbi:MAG: RecX family transcriptional regulator [Microbacteriaceae bacterium]